MTMLIQADTAQQIQEELLGITFAGVERYSRFQPSVFDTGDPCERIIDCGGLQGTTYEWWSWLPFYLFNKPIELNVTREMSGRESNAYAKAYPRSEDQARMCKKYFGSVRHKNDPFVSILSLLREFGILEIFDKYFPEYKTCIIKRFIVNRPAFHGLLKARVLEVVGRFDDSMADLALKGVLPHGKIVVCDKRFANDLDFAKRTLIMKGVKADNVTTAELQHALRSASTDKSLTSVSHPQHHFFYSDHFGVPLHIDIVGLKEYDTKSKIDNDTLIDVYNRCGQGKPFDLSPKERADIDGVEQYILNFIRRFPFVADSAEVAARESRAKSFSRAGGNDCDVEHFVHRVKTASRGLNPHIPRVIYVMTNSNHRKLFSGRSIQDKFTIAVEKEWWTPKTAKRERDEMAKAVRDEEDRQRSDFELSEEIANCKIPGL